jgi:hypothetical protein
VLLSAKDEKKNQEEQLSRAAQNENFQEKHAKYALRNKILNLIRLLVEAGEKLESRANSTTESSRKMNNKAQTSHKIKRGNSRTYVSAT